ncbi:MAG: adenylate kinase [Eubacterium sp.]|nr:adenylate kinase [Lachnospiraceae bacterium]MBQ2627688.1 adenylate kinase [Eubacterium sp.]MBQ6363234.1 adenylate kinase [Lachnospiraceae bacterium]MBR4456504.1 adenylate kinase [Solobacterium sp.]
MKIVMLGAPGAGKGTQAIMISEKFGLPHISTGDIFRSNIKNGTELGKEAKKYMDEGRLVPDELTVRILLDRVSREDCAGGYVLDGFPRTIPQAEVLTKELSAMGDAIDFALNIDVPDENIVNRMSGRRSCPSCGATYHIQYVPPKKEGICDECGNALILRDDDKPETVLNRLKVYHEQTQPLIDYYNAAGVLRTIDGTRDVDTVFNEICSILED